MPIPGLSLIGFFGDHRLAMGHLFGLCVPANPAPEALQVEWRKAKLALGPPMPNAGNPNIQTLPANHAQHAAKILSDPLLTGPWRGAQIRLVEIDPLLSCQVTINKDRCAHHSKFLSEHFTIDELINICLPLDAPIEQFSVTQSAKSLVISSDSLNLKINDVVVTRNGVNISFGMAVPWITVVRYAGRCYLSNGYHRCICARWAGATHIPCVIRDITDFNAADMDPPAFFDLTTLTSADPPTLGHFTQGRALPVYLRRHGRRIHIKWNEYAVPVE